MTAATFNYEFYFPQGDPVEIALLRDALELSDVSHSPGLFQIFDELRYKTERTPTERIAILTRLRNVMREEKRLQANPIPYNPKIHGRII